MRMAFAPMRLMMTCIPALLVACGGEQQDNAAAATAWRIDSLATLSISDDDAGGEPVIGDAVGVSRLPDGGVVVADLGLSSLRYFGPRGEFLRAVGRKGSGPGEFDYIATMLRCGDSLYVEDIGQQSVMVYATDGTLARSPKYADVLGERPTYDSACNGAGIFLHNGWGSRDDRTLGRVRWTVPYWLTTSDGKSRAELGEHAGSERLMIGGGSQPHPLGRSSVLAIGRERAYIGTADSFVVLAFTLDGAPAGALTNSDADLRTTDADIERFKRLDTLGKNEEQRARAVRAWTTFEFPPTVPAYDAMLVDANDHVWVRRFPRGTDKYAEWLVFSPSGEQVATLALPGTLTVHEIGSDYVLGVEVNPAEGNQMVRQYRLQRGD